MLQLHDIRKSYTTGNFTQKALDGVSLNFRDNEFVAILGPSGSGKTTLLNIVGGLDHYDSGDLAIDGVSTKEYSDRDWDTYRNNRIGFVFQSYNLIPHQTVLANVEMALTLSGVNPAERKQRATAALERVGLGDHIDKKPSQMSGGQMQRVAIARALINDPEILLADEPTGALDSKTSVQVMNLLQEIANERLVIMVTHNPELANEYATRIVNVQDGQVVGDTDPFNPSEAELADARAAKPTRRASMSFLTALALSFSNLMTKKGRTIMTAFAGSIGIIGIAAILSLANGVNSYIMSVEEETLSQYPLQIMSTGFDMTSMMAMSGASSSDDAAGEEKVVREKVGRDTGRVGVAKMITTMLDSIGSNDLESLKKYLDSGESGIEEHVNTIEYSYSTVPQIFSANTEKVHQVNPDKSFSSLGLGSGSTNSIMSMSMSTDVFYEMPEERSLYANQYDVVAGHWPEKYDECVLVLTQSGRISDFMLYTLGLRDNEELQSMVKQFLNEEEVAVPSDISNYDYEDILGVTFKLVSAPDMYQYDTTYSVWKDKTDDTDYMKDLISNGEDLKIVGIAQPTEDTNITMLRAGINYLPALTYHVIDTSAKSQIVKDQLADDKRDVFTGKTFEELAEDNKSNGFEMGSLFSIDSNAIQSAFQFDQNALKLDTSALANAMDPKDLGKYMNIDMTKAPQMEGVTIDPAAVRAAAEDVSNDFQNWVKSAEGQKALAEKGINPMIQPQEAMQLYFETPQGQAKVAQATASILQGPMTSYMAGPFAKWLQGEMTKSMTAAMGAMAQNMSAALQKSMTTMMSGLGDAMHVDSSAFARAFNFNMTEEDLREIMMSFMNVQQASYQGNLTKLGYSDYASPSEISIYPKNFESKQSCKDILDAYNEDMKAQEKEDQVVSYTDIVGALMSSVTTIIDAISAVLIAFVAISLVVSSIMIGIITYISVLERKKEIGILRAMGASKGDIARVFNAETIIVGLLAGIIGVGLTAIACVPVSIIVKNIYDVPNVMQLPLLAAFILVCISVFLTFVGGLIPSSSASRKDPVEALRSE